MNRLNRNITMTALIVMSTAINANPAPKSIDTTDLQLEYIRSEKSQTEDALRLSSKWVNASNKPFIDASGRVIYTYGVSMPELICKPLMVCSIALEPGEKVKSAKAGDNKRWVIGGGESGEGDTATPHITVKPVVDGLETTLFITTDRRAYYLTLRSSIIEFLPMIGFAYGNDGTAKGGDETLSTLIKNGEDSKAKSSQAQAVTKEEVLGSNLDFSYTWDTTTRLPWVPVRVFDDGLKTYIDVPKDVVAREIPALLITDSDRRGTMINYRFIEGRYIVDGLFDHAILAIGKGRKQKKVSIDRVYKSGARDAWPLEQVSR